MTDQAPRERLRRLGAHALADAELLALLLRTGHPGRSARRLADELLAHGPGLRGLARSAAAELEALPGMGPAKSATLQAALELSRRLATHRLQPGDAVRGPEDVHRHFYPRLRDTLQECFAVLLLDGRHRVLREHVVSKGTLTASLVHPREVFREAVREAAAAIVLVHNHPSGDPRPSLEDRQVTRRLAEAGALLGVQVVDHVIVAESGYHSLGESGELDSRGARGPHEASAAPPARRPDRPFGSCG